MKELKPSHLKIGSWAGDSRLNEARCFGRSTVRAQDHDTEGEASITAGLALPIWGCEAASGRPLM